jgi:hypothetical protein
MRPASTWHAVFREHTPAGLVPFARIRTRSGTVWAGVVYEYSPNLEVADRELILGPPLASSTTNTSFKALPAVWQRVVLRHDEIEWIAVKYIPDPAPVLVPACTGSAPSRNFPALAPG